MTITSEDDLVTESTTADKYDGRDYFKERPDAVGANGYLLSQAFLDGVPGPIVQPAAGSASANSGGTRRRHVANATTNNVNVATNIATATTTADHGFLIGDLISTTGLSVNATNVPVLSVPASNQITYSLTTGNGDLADEDGTIIGVGHHGLIWFDDPGSDTLYLTQLEGLGYSINLSLLLIDRLVDVATISLTSTGLKDVNSVPLPRVTSGDGVEMFIELSSAVSGGPPVVNARYTNSSGTASRQGASLTLNASSPTRSLIRLPFQGTDQGARSIQQLEVETAGSGGVATIVLGKVYATVVAPSNSWNYVETLARAEESAVFDGRPTLFIAHLAGGTSTMLWSHARIGVGWG